MKLPNWFPKRYFIVGTLLGSVASAKCKRLKTDILWCTVHHIDLKSAVSKFAFKKDTSDFHVLPAKINGP